MLRQYFPKGTNLRSHGADQIATVADELNDRPRKTLGWHTPAALLADATTRPRPARASGRSGAPVPGSAATTGA